MVDAGAHIDVISRAAGLGRARQLAPAPDHGGAVLVSERAQRSRAKREQGAILGRKPQPASGQYAQHVAVTERDPVAIGGADLAEHTVGARPDVRGRLPIRAAVAPQAPTGALPVDLRGGEALIVAVVPLAQVLLDLDLLFQTGELAGLDGALQRARQHEGEPALA